MGSFARARRLMPRRLRLQASFWTSVCVVALLLACQVAWWLQPEDSSFDLEGGFDSFSAKPRRLDISPVYPNDLILKKKYYEDPNRWLVIVHCIAIGYMLVGLNHVCDVYFCGALDVMVEQWNVQEDVAGATFMAAGGSMPELFTSVIGVAVESDVGFSTIVGSAVFNVLFVIGLCGYYAKTEIALSWWPLFRDCTYYILGLMCLAGCCFDKKVVLWEASALFGLYIGYCILMFFNKSLQPCVDSSARKKTKQVVPADDQAEAAEQTVEDKVKTKEDQLKEHEIVDVDRHDPPEATPEATPEGNANEDNAQTEGDKKEEKEEKDGDDEDEDDEDFGDFLKKPSGIRDQISWYLSMPVYITLYYLVPEPSKKWFLVTFGLSLVWIIFFSFILVWCVEILADVVFAGSEFASTFMGFTVLAAGTSIPDLVSSVNMAMKGKGDMAVSSSIGSNIFDILFGLPVPWMIKLAARIKGEDGTFKGYVAVNSPYMFFYVLLLLIMVTLTITSIHFVGWKLNKPLGGIMVVLYIIFLLCALPTEVFRPDWLLWG